MKNKDLLVLFLNHLDKMDLLPFNRLYNYDSFSQEFLDSNEAKINYTRCCTELKGKEVISFEDWYKDNGYYINDYEWFDKNGRKIVIYRLKKEYKKLKQNL